MKRISIMMMIVGTAAMIAACDAPANKAGDENYKYTIDSFADLKVMRYRIPGWENLSLQQKEYAYHLAEAAKWELSWEDYFEPVVEDLSDGKLVSGLKKGIKGVKAGEVCYILFSGKYGYGDKQYGTIPAKSALAYYVEVVEVNNNE